MALPESITARASLSGLEYGWSVTEFPAVLSEATAQGFACVGGQFQFHLPDGTCEMYWLNANSTPRCAGETWQTYVQRSQHEVRTAFARICAKTDFLHEAQQ